MKDFLFYKWKYFFSELLSFLSSKLTEDVIFVVEESARNWIFDTQCKRVADAFKTPGRLWYTKNFKNIPIAGAYFYPHYRYFSKIIRYNPAVNNARNIVIFTHPNWNRRYTKDHVMYLLKKADQVICLNSSHKRMLIENGLEDARIHIMHLAADPNIFTFHERGGGKVGLSMAYYPRKNPDLLFEIVQKIPEKKFLLLGKNWGEYSKFRELLSFTNFEYHEDIPYEDYPSFYHKMDVFLSTSTLEGGPVPLLEAMLSNAVPVVSRTGFCPDVVKHGINGYLFETDASPKNVCELIYKAFAMKANVRDSVIEFSWKRYSKDIERFMRD